ncbi:MAG: M48 family metallopeptidase [Prevotellaceae bacterium]|jgi:predicted Zn-dependent protease|nr:M48 family metallopeptidase [Prevotellaceae bacterium]
MKRIIAILLISVLMFACKTVPFTGRKQLSLISNQTVLTLSLQQYNDFIHSAQLSNDANAKAMVTRVGQRLAAAVSTYYRSNGKSAELKNFSWEFNLVNSTQVNAFCMPGGKIVVYTGILQYTQTEDGLAVVLGHEIAHALAQHANERLSQQVAVQLGGIGLDVALSNKSQETRNLGAAVFGLGAQVGVLLPFSRKHELEADRIGLILMAMAGYNPQTAPAFWQRMAANGTKTPEFFSTHPSDANRIKQLQSCMPEALRYYKK